VGDEAAMLAASLADVPIGVGKWREGVGRELLANTPTDVVVLDDGFQYFRLARELDIVLVDALRPLGEQRLFPAGTLREPASHLRRAQAVWITHADLAPAAALAGVRGEVTALAPEAVVAVTRHRALTMRLLHNGREVEPASQIADARVLALSSIGNPLAFEMSLSRLGAREVVPLRFPDHHQYTGADAAAIAERASETGRVVTTEKDAVRLQPVTVGADVWVLRCELEILEGADRALSLIEGAVR
jgi:tetraacyldisaccharide 4'-kinase